MWWLTFKANRGIEVFVVEASHLLSARHKAGITGQEREFQEGHFLGKTAKRVPKDYIRAHPQPYGGAEIVVEARPTVCIHRVRWATANSPPDRATQRKQRERSKILKELPHPSRDGRPRKAPEM